MSVTAALYTFLTRGQKLLKSLSKQKKMAINQMGVKLSVHKKIFFFMLTCWKRRHGEVEKPLPRSLSLIPGSSSHSDETLSCSPAGLQIRGGKGYFSIDFLEFSIEN